MRDIELLAPAKNAEIGIEAIRHGADAVYMGAAHHGARASAGNSIADIARVVDYAHRFHAKVYVTVNTLVYDNELSDVEQLVRELYKIGVDAIIVQDLALLRLDIPPIALHASTQCDIRSVEKAKFYESLGFSQLVLPREFTREEIMAVAGSLNVPIESFVHGALCVCYSGRCQLSQYVKGRSANRGECAQMCRLAYDLEDEQGNKMLRNKHLLSLRDLNMSRQLREMIDTGVSSFKIEGRLKDIDYVKNVVAYYSRAIDRVISGMPECRRASQGAVRLDFVPDLQKSFNRSFTTYFFDERKPQRASMASIQTPKSIGEPIGKFTAVKGKTAVISTSATIANGDGLSFFNAEKDFCG
ncbi:MAG: U32 family peptidase, partial [Muribaculaceae bacterium]|nr:U32 family peptidase [Muribaculaceae bacterium]